MSNFRKLAALGQSIWCDYIRRGMIESGELQGLIDEGILGITSNPTIFQKAIGESDDYDAAIDELRARGVREPGAIYESLAFEDIGRTADLFRPVYDRTDRRDGFVSIEVEPDLAHDTAGTIDRGRYIFRTLARPNVMVKVPATEAGLPAIEQLIAQGINVNVTLIFSVDVYSRVMEAYLKGLRSYLDHGGNPSAVASVASFFVSRVDTMVDDYLQKGIDSGQTHRRDLLGQAAVANSKLAYARFLEVFGGPAFADLRERGARVQRPLWASTSTKNPSYRETLYVDTLVGRDTVNTAPPATLDAIRRMRDLPTTLAEGIDEAAQVLRRVDESGLRMSDVTEHLRIAGVKAFAGSFDKLLADIREKSRSLARG